MTDYNYAYAVREILDEEYDEYDYWLVGTYEVIKVDGYVHGCITGKVEFSFSEKIFGFKAREKAEQLCERLNRKANKGVRAA